jgi:hypothetical protein
MRLAQDRTLAAAMWIIASNHHAAMTRALDQLYDFIRGMDVRPDPKVCADAENMLTFAEDWVKEAMRECIEAEARYNWVHCTYHGRVLDAMSEQAGSTIPILRGQLRAYDEGRRAERPQGRFNIPELQICGVLWPHEREELPHDPSQKR